MDDELTKAPGRDPFAMVSVLAVAALALAGVVGVGVNEAAAATLDESPPPPSTIEPPKAERAPRGERTRSPRRLSPEAKPDLDRTGRARIGKASFYAHMFAGRKMADGTPMKPTGNNAASRTLPLGTTAKVTNLKTGKTAVVTIRDRGPYVDGRIVDLSPATASKIGLDRRTGVTEVVVAPIVVPLPNGRMKLGDGVPEVNDNERLASTARAADLR